MSQKIAALVLLLLILVSCSQKNVDDVVIYGPKDAKAGNKINITFLPKRLISPEQQNFSVYLIYQIFGSRAVRQGRVLMDGKIDHFVGAIKTKTSDYLLSFKFEDNMDRCEDNNGRGWNVVLKDKHGKVQRNSFYKLGSIYNNTLRTGRYADYKKAIENFKAELSLYPNNYLVWYDLWFSKLRLSAFPSKELKSIKWELDSLLTHQPSSANLLALAFKTNLKLLNNPEKALNIGEKLISGFENFSQKDEIRYSLIFLKNGSNLNAIVNDLMLFLNQTKNKDYLKKVCLQLGMFYRQQRKSDRSLNYYKKYLEIDPYNISTRLILANYYLKQGKLEVAQEMINRSQEMNNSELVLKSNLWDTPVERTSKLNLTQCQILSTRAALNYVQKDFQQAIENRKKCIKLKTPFPAYEWEKIGDIFIEKGETDSACQAYIKALSINSTEDGAKIKLKTLFQQQGNPSAQFDSYLNTVIRDELKASANAAPKIMLTDLQNTTVNLFQQKGKITALIFWDSWSEACQKEIADLNKLKEGFIENNNVSFWAVSVEDATSLNKFIRKTPFNFRIFHSGFAAKKAFEVIGFPTHFIIDADGKIRFTHVGFSNNIHSELKREIRLLIDELTDIS